MKQFILFLCLLATAGYNSFGQAVPVINILYTSDAHFGITRKQFRGDTAVPSYKVSAAMIAQMNTMPGIRLPLDNGVGAGKDISNVSYLVESGDIANRMEPPYQSASASWQQFLKVYQNGLKLNAPDGKPTQLLLLVGNHDISNAIGYPKKMEPSKDATVMVEIHKLMMPETPVPDEQNFDYSTGKIHYSKNIGGIHFMFINLWADSAERIWMEADLKNVDKKVPVIIFAHDQPTCEAKHFNNPLSPGIIVPGSKFENLLAEKYKEANQAEKGEHATDLEQRGWEEFLKQNANIKAYFHGNSNFNEFYTYHGPGGGVNLPVFRVDSPMKGDVSSKDETKLSFQLISLDPQKKLLTVRECLWNMHPFDPKQQVTFGSVKTISL